MLDCMSSTFLYWLTVAEFVLVELPLAAVAYGAVSNAFYITPTTSLIWRILAFAINLVAWVAICWIFYPKMSLSKSARTRGDALEKVHTAYFVVPMLVHLLIVLLWIAHRVQFAGLSPLNFSTNIDAFHVLRSIETVSLVLFTLVLSFCFYDTRHRALHMMIVKTPRSAQPPQQTQQN